MSASGWMRKRKAASAPEGDAGALVRASVRGNSLSQLLDLAVQGLLERASADRAGLRLAGERRDVKGCGQGVESIPGPIPGHCKKLDTFSPFLLPTLSNHTPVLVASARVHHLSRG